MKKIVNIMLNFVSGNSFVYVDLIHLFKVGLAQHFLEIIIIYQKSEMDIMHKVYSSSTHKCWSMPSKKTCFRMLILLTRTLHCTYCRCHYKKLLLAILRHWRYFTLFLNFRITDALQQNKKVLSYQNEHCCRIFF